MASTATQIPLSDVLASIAEELSKANQAAKNRGFAPMKFGEGEDVRSDLSDWCDARLTVWLGAS